MNPVPVFCAFLCVFVSLRGNITRKDTKTQRTKSFRVGRNKESVQVRNILLFALILFTIQAYAQHDKSDRLKPDWLVHGPPVPVSTGIEYKIVSSQGNDLEKARDGCTARLTDMLATEQEVTVKGVVTTVSKSTKDESGRKETIGNEYTYTYEIEGKSYHVHFKKVDEYWEMKYGLYHCHVLYAVAREPDMPVQFDDVTFSYRYGVRGLCRSLVVPGWGQMYKGSTVKGILILGGEAALAGGIIACENLNRSYLKKIKETHNTKHIQTYADKADNYENIRNVCIGAAAALYIYNLVDAMTLPGRKQTMVNSNVAFVPFISPSYTGIALTFKF